MRQKKISKTEALRRKLTDLRAETPEAMSKCIKNGICISAECVSQGTSWRVVIELKDKAGGIIERIESDGRTKKEDLHKNKLYYSKQDYEIKVMELYIYYAKTLES